MNIRFDGKRALVTGAGKGIGRAIAKALVECGAETVALSRTQSDLDSLKEECPTIKTVCVDLSGWDATRKAVQNIGPIDLLVNNAAVGKSISFMDTTEELIDETLSINLKAVFNVSQVVAKGMIERGRGGGIVNVSTLGTAKIVPGRGVYSTSKGGVDQLTKVMAEELGPHQIRVNAVNPSVVMTRLVLEARQDPVTDAYLRRLEEQTPLRKQTELRDVVGPVLFLLSDKADMVHGILLRIDGGVSFI